MIKKTNKMIDLNKNYWLYIASHVYFCLKDKRALLYNTQNGMNIESDDPLILSLLEVLHERKNLGSAYYEGKKLIQSPYKEFITEFIKKGMGGIADVLEVKLKPIQLMPVLNLQCDVDRIIGGYSGEGALENLLELNIYLNSNCKYRCRHCSNYSQQSLCCHCSSDEKSESLHIPLLKSVLNQIKNGVVGKLNLLGGNPFQYPHYNELKDIFYNYKGQVHVWNHYGSFSKQKSFISDFFYDVIVPFPLNENLLNSCLPTINDLNSKFHFYITDSHEYEEVEKLTERYEISNYQLHPVYIKTNHDFFYKYVYLDKEDIFEELIPFRQIFAHQKLNTYFFGSLTILTNGNVYANLNSEVLGNIKVDTLLEMINKEMIINTAWRKTRNKKPCSDCLYQYLCPSPSNYEYVIGKSNLCTIKE